jgi:predicted MPP superfamily phosphohydrolase
MNFYTLFGMIIGASHYYIFARLSDFFGLGPHGRVLAALMTGCLSLLTLLTIPISYRLPRRAAVIFSWFAYTWMGFVLLLFAAVVAGDLCWLALNISPLSAASLAALKPDFGRAILYGTMLLCAISVWNGLRPARVRPISVTLEKLPPALDGFRIAQITDLHVSALTRTPWLEGIVASVNRLVPDLIAVTGDMVDGTVEDLGPHAAPLGKLSAPLGVYAITGNHEYYSGVGPWVAFFTGLGLRFLRNARVTVSKNGASLDLAGVDDYAAGRMGAPPADLPKALAGRDPALPVVLLAHQPAAIEEAARLGIDLQLSGHTHAGQIFPFNLLVRLQQPYVRGLHTHPNSGTQIYVSPGTGFWGPPMRFLTRAEITLITLRSPAAAKA